MRKSHYLSGVAIALLAVSSISPARVVAFDNVLTGLIPDLYEALDVVSRELVGYLPGIKRSATAERAALNEAVKYHIAPVPVAGDVTPAMTITEPPAQTIDNGTITITKSRSVPFGFVGEEQRGLNNGPGYLSVQGDMIAQALRVLVNEMETDVANAAALAASRAYGAGGTVPFTTDLEDAAQIRKILDDNGAPASGRSLVINTTTGVKVRKLSQLTKVNEAGTSMTLRDGALLDIFGFAMRESAASRAHTKGTNAAATTSGTALPVGTTVIPLAAASTGTIVAGDIITLAGDTNKYIVLTGDPDVSNGGSITINAPGLRVAVPAVATVITTANSYSANVGFSSDAIVLATRAPAMPQEGDARSEMFMLTDPRSGITFEISIWKGNRKVKYEIAAAWGVKAVKPAHIAMLAG